MPLDRTDNNILRHPWAEHSLTLFAAGKNREGAEEMTLSRTNSSTRVERIAATIESFGHQVLRYGMVLVIGWIGLMKFTAYEAKGIQPFVAHSPFMSWMYHVWTVRQFSTGLGVVEVGIAILIALRPWSPKASVVGSALAVLMFLTTLSFLFTTPGWEPTLGFPALSALPGQFLVKDAVLLGAALWLLGEALAGCRHTLRTVSQDNLLEMAHRAGSEAHAL